MWKVQKQFVQLILESLSNLFQADCEGDARASHLLRITGAALARSSNMVCLYSIIVAGRRVSLHFDSSTILESLSLQLVLALFPGYRLIYLDLLDWDSS